MELKANAHIRIKRPIDEVFQAIVDPRKLEGFFVSASSGPLEEGATVRWEWKDHDASTDVKVARVELDRSIVLKWPGTVSENEITFNFESDGTSTKVAIEEDGWPKDDKGIAAYGRNMQGWMNFLTCLKAYVEYGINLRKGAF